MYRGTLRPYSRGRARWLAACSSSQVELRLMAAKVAQEIRLGDLFVKEGLITEQQLQEGLAEAKTTGTRIGYALVHLGFTPSEI